MRIVTFLAVLLLSCSAFGQNATPQVPIQRLRPATGAPAPRFATEGATIEAAQAAPRAAVTVNGEVVVEAAEAEDVEVDEVARKKQRDAALKKLTFDRRPSSILKAWSRPFDPNEAENNKTKEQKEKEAEAKAKAAAIKKEAEDKAKKAAAKAEKERLAAEEKMTEEERTAAAEARKLAGEAKKTAEETAAKNKKKAERLAKEIEQLKIEIRRFQRNVTLGDWKAVDTFMKSLSEDEAKVVYTQLLTSLINGPPGQPKTRQGSVIGQFNQIRASDVLAVAELCPQKKLSSAMISQLGRLVNLCQREGQAEYIFLDELKEHVAADSKEAAQKINKRAAARILFAANRIDQARSFLPSIQDATKNKDAEALSILTDVFLKLYAKEDDPKLLESSWDAAQALLVCEGAENVDKLKAMKRSVSLVPRLKDALGQQWLTDSFTANPQKGMEILAGIGSETALSMSDKPQNTEERKATLALQTTAVEALLQKAPQNAAAWSETLHLLAVNWLREATYSRKYDQTTSRGPTYNRDSYGNYYWSSGSSSSRPLAGMPQPLSSGDVLDARPGEKWLTHLQPGYRSQFAIETARLHLRVKEEHEAFPFIETLATTHPEEATDLVREFFEVWAENHDPNTQQRRTSYYMFSYGFNQRSNGIPLTRSRQVRNLQELSEIVKRVRKLPLDDIEDKWISAAFTQVHSSAEVYQLKDMEQVFGKIENIGPETTAALVQTMRANLASIWRKPETQQQAKTKRKRPEIQKEVVDGYAEAVNLLNDAIKKYPSSWELTMAQASTMHDENDYRAQLKHSPGFAGSRKAALELFSQAVDKYAATVEGLKENQYDVDPFLMWFNAALGAPDLGQITQEKLPVLSQMPLIKAAFQRLPETARKQHAKIFANLIFTRMSSVNPAVKFRYVRHGLDVAGTDFEQAREAEKLFEYYNDLVSEIKLETLSLIHI